MGRRARGDGRGASAALAFGSEDEGASGALALGVEGGVASGALAFGGEGGGASLPLNSLHSVICSPWSSHILWSSCTFSGWSVAIHALKLALQPLACI